MTDAPTPPDLPVEPARKSLLERLSIVWIIPLIALVIALAVAWQSYQSRGPVIEIAFDNASGVAANETELRYRDVAVGVVERVTFTNSLDQVLVRVRLDKDVAEYVDADAQFWVVSPQISTEGIEGLGTVLTGVYIEGLWNTEIGAPASYFNGLSEAPLSRDGTPGLRIRLRATGESGLTENAPIVYRGINVGRIGRAEVSEDGSTVEAEAMIFAPHDRMILNTTRFWDTSGFTFNLGPSGAEIDFSSLASLISGGITFSTVVSGGQKAEEGTIFSVYSNEGQARESALTSDGGAPLLLSIVFDDNVSGLGRDSPVDLGGIRVGRVTSVNGLVDAERFGDRKVRLAVTISLQPTRLGLTGADAEPEAALNFLDGLVRDGLRARLVTSSILTGGLKVELAETDAQGTAAIDRDIGPNPVIPSTESQIADVAATAEGVFERINALPIEGLMESAINAMDNVSRFVGSDDMRRVPTDIRGLVTDARGLIGAEETQALPARIGAITGELQTLVTRLNEQEAATRILAAIDAVTAAGNAASEAVVGMPELIASLEAVAANAADLPLQDLVGQVRDLAANAATLVGNESTQALPGRIDAIAAQVGTLVQQLNDQEVSTRLLAAVDAVTEAGNAASEAVVGMPELIASLEAVAANAAELPLQDLVAQVRDVAANASTLLGRPETQAIPASITGTMAQVTALLSDLRERDIAGATADALVALRDVAGEVSGTFDGVPGLIERIDGVAAQVQTLPLDQLVTQLAGVAESARGVLNTDGARELPASVNATLTEVTALVAELRARDFAGTLTETLASAREAATRVSSSVEGVPELVERIDAVAAKVQNVPLDELSNNLSGLLASADALIGTDAARQLPADLSAALDSLRQVLDDLREGGVIENANRTLASASSAADSIASATDGLPALIQRAQQVLVQATTTIQGYDAANGVGRDAERALREVERAAAAVTALARALERNPNSLLFGR